jgi:hypothetical protein
MKRNNQPTVLVTVSSKSKESWKSTRDLIVKILDRHELPTVAVEIIKDEIWRGPHRSTDIYGRPGLEREILQEPGLIGQSIAPYSTKTTSGSLKGFLKLQFSDGQWREFALTSLRCVFPVEDDGIEPQYLEGKGRGHFELPGEYQQKYLNSIVEPTADFHSSHERPTRARSAVQRGWNRSSASRSS